MVQKTEVATCMAITDLGISSLWLRMAKCQLRMRSRSSKLNSTIRRPSVYPCHIYVRCEQVMRKMLNTLVNIGFPCWVTIVAWSQSKLTVAWRRGECLYDELIPLQKAYFITDMEASHGKEMTKYEIYLLCFYDIVFQIFLYSLWDFAPWMLDSFFYVESYFKF